MYVQVRSVALMLYRAMAASIIKPVRASDRDIRLIRRRVYLAPEFRSFASVAFEVLFLVSLADASALSLHLLQICFQVEILIIGVRNH